MNTKTLILTVIATTLSVASFPVTKSEAALSANGRSLNGIQMNERSQQGTQVDGIDSINGRSLNGIQMNERSQQGTQVDGIDSINGRSLNGLVSNGLTSNGLAKQGIQLNGSHVNGQPSQATVSQDSAQTGLTLSNPSFSSIRVEGGRLVGVK